MLKTLFACAATALVAGCATYDYGYGVGASYYDYGPGYYAYDYGPPYAYGPYYGWGYGPWYAPPVVSGGVVISGGGGDRHWQHDHARNSGRTYSREGQQAVTPPPGPGVAEGHSRSNERDSRAISREAAAGP